MSGVEIKWEDPPDDPRGGDDSAKIAAALRSRPGVWAKVRVAASASLAGNWRAGSNKNFPVGEFEFASRSNGTRGKADVYARYVGGDS